MEFGRASLHAEKLVQQGGGIYHLLNRRDVRKLRRKPDFRVVVCKTADHVQRVLNLAVKDGLGHVQPERVVPVQLELHKPKFDVFGERRGNLPFQPSVFRQNGHLNALIKHLGHRLGGELDIAENQHRIDFMTLHIQKDLVVLFKNQPVSRFS